METRRDFIENMGRSVWNEDDASKVEAAIQDGFNPNYYDSDGATTIHSIAAAGCVNALNVFLTHEITRLDVIDHMGRTPLHYAAMCINFEKSVEIAKLLVSAGIAVDIMSNDINNPTALFLAVRQKNELLARYLIDNGANINMRNFSAENLLLKLSTEHNVYTDVELESIVSMLLYYNIDINWPFNAHPLFIAFIFGRRSLLDLFMHFSTFDFAYVKDQCPFNMVLLAIVGFSGKVNLEHDKVLYLMDLLDFDEITDDGIYKSLAVSNKSRDLRLFNYLLSRLSRNEPRSYDLRLEMFFSLPNLTKADFFYCLERMFENDTGLVWQEASLSVCLVRLIQQLRTHLSLSKEEVEEIFYLIVPYISGFTDIDLYCILHAGGFTCFELFLNFDPLVSLTSPALISDNDPDKIFFKQLCIPSYQPKRRKKKREVASLLCLSRDVIRKNLQPQFSAGGRYHYFRYYKEVQKLPIPQIIKDIITLKRLI